MAMDYEFMKSEYKKFKKLAVQKIPLDYIVETDNIRGEYDPEGLAELGASIKADGLKQPVVLVEIDAGKYEIEFGHRRVRASRLVGLETIDAQVKEPEERLVGADRIVGQLVENIQREDLSSADLEKGVSFLIHTGMGPEEVAKKLHKSYSWVYRLTSANSKRMTLDEAGVDTEALSTNVLSFLPAEPEEMVKVVQELQGAQVPVTAKNIETFAPKAPVAPPSVSTQTRPQSEGAATGKPKRGPNAKAAPASLEDRVKALVSFPAPSEEFKAGFLKALELALKEIKAERAGV